MKCPKCGFFGPDHLDTCKKCGNDVSAERKKLGLTRLRRHPVQSQEAAPEAAPFAETLREESPEPAVQTVKPKAATPSPLPLSKEPEAIVQKDLELAEKTVALRPEQLEEPPGGPAAETFQFGAEGEDVQSAPLDKTMNMKDLREDAGPGRGVSDDFEFPDIRESKPPLDMFSGEKDDLSSTLAMPDILEPESASPAPPLADDEIEDFSGDETLVDATISLGDEDVSLQTGEMLRQERQEKEDTGTVLLRPEEVEDILQSEIPSFGEGQGGPSGEGSKTELLGVDELSKVLDDLDTDFTKENNDS